MAKDQPKTESKKDTSTPFQKFDRLAKRIVRVPKHKARERDNGKSQQDSG